MLAALFACTALVACGSGGSTPDAGSGNPPPAGAINWGPERILATNPISATAPVAVFGTNGIASVLWGQAGFQVTPATVPLVRATESSTGTAFDSAPVDIESTAGGSTTDFINTLAAARSAAGSSASWRRSLGGLPAATRLSAARRSSAGWASESIVDNIPASSGATELATAVNDAGDRIAVWTETGTGVRIVRLSSDASSDSATWESPFDFGSGAGSASAPAVAIDANGLAMIVWRQGGATQGQIFARSYNVRTRTPGNALAIDPTQLGIDVLNPRVAALGLDDFIATWEQSAGTTYDLRANRGNSVAWQSGAGSPIAVDASTALVDQSKLVAGGPGVAFAVWRQSNAVFFSRFTTANGLWFQPREVGANLPTGISASPVLASDGAGNLLIVWIEFSSAADLAYALFTGANTTLSSSFLLDSQAGDVSFPSVSIASNGAAVVTWLQAVQNQNFPNVVARVFRP